MSDTTRAVQTQKMAGDLKFWVQEEDGLYYLCFENEGVDQLHMQKEGFHMTRCIYHC